MPHCNYLLTLKTKSIELANIEYIRQLIHENKEHIAVNQFETNYAEIRSKVHYFLPLI